MRIDIQQRGIEHEETFERYRQHAKRRLRFALSRFVGAIERITVRLVDLDSPQGGIDKHCRIQVRIKGHNKNLIADDTDSDLNASIDRAVERMRRTLNRRLEMTRVVGEVQGLQREGTNMKAMAASDVTEHHMKFRGKVRDVYDLDEEYILIVATDRISAFDVVLPTAIPGKGRVLTELSNFWFERTANIIPNHLAHVPLVAAIGDRGIARNIEGRAAVVRRTTPLGIKAIVRGYLSGTGWADYQATGQVCGVRLPGGLVESQRLPGPIYTPSTKARPGEHDENISFAQAAELIGPELAERVRDVSVALYLGAAAWAEQCGIIIADTKFEFGLCDGELILIDELLTPDSSRFWDTEAYSPGQPQPSFDKQFVRDYLTDVGWERKPPAPPLPPSIVSQTSERYREALSRLTGRYKAPGRTR